MASVYCESCGSPINYTDNYSVYLRYGLEDNYCLDCHYESAKEEAEAEDWGEYEYQAYETLKNTYSWTGVHRLVDWVKSVEVDNSVEIQGGE